jgi:hypothetical protein
VELRANRRPLWCAAFLAALEAVGGRKSIAAEAAEVDIREVRRRIRFDASFFQDVEAVYMRLEQKRIESALAYTDNYGKIRKSA